MILFSHFRGSQTVCYTVTLMAEMKRVSEVSDVSKALLFADGPPPPTADGGSGGQREHIIFRDEVRSMS